MLDIISKEQFILFLFFLLIRYEKWNIITILVFIFIFEKIRNDSKSSVSKEIASFNDSLNNINFYESENFYYKKFLKLEALKNKYPLQMIRNEQIKTINGMLIQIPLSPSDETKWLAIRDTLLRSNPGTS
jgi:hypothetical protein